VTRDHPAPEPPPTPQKIIKIACLRGLCENFLSDIEHGCDIFAAYCDRFCVVLLLQAQRIPFCAKLPLAREPLTTLGSCYVSLYPTYWCLLIFFFFGVQGPAPRGSDRQPAGQSRLCEASAHAAWPAWALLAAGLVSRIWRYPSLLSSSVSSHAKAWPVVRRMPAASRVRR